MSDERPSEPAEAAEPSPVSPPPQGFADTRWTRLTASLRALIARTVGEYRLVRVAVATVRLFRRCQGGARSAEIAYYAILSTIPFGALLLTGLAYAAVDLMDSGWSREQLLESIRNLFASFSPTPTPEIEQGLEWLLSGRHTMGLVGSVALLLTASMVFGALSRALSSVFEHASRNRFTTLMLFMVALMALTILVVLGLPSLMALSAVFERHLGWSRDVLAPGWVHFSGACVLGLSFLFLVAAVVRVRVAFKPLVLGALIFVLLFETARLLFTIYLDEVSRLHLIYGSLASAMAGILWAYYVAFSFIVSMCVVRVLNDTLHQGALGELNQKKPGTRA